MIAITGVTRTFIAGGSINAFKTTRLSTTEDNTVHHNTSATTHNVGISLSSASDGDPVTVILSGTAKVVANAQIVKGAKLKADTSGGIRTTTTSGNDIAGVALNSTTQTVTVSGTEIIEVDLGARGSRY